MHFRRVSETVGIAVLLFWMASTAGLAQDDRGVTREERAKLHERAWAIHRIADQWEASGDTSHYIFLNMPQFYLHSFINRSGSVRKLPFALRDDVASFVTKTGLGELSLSEYVHASVVDGFLIVHKGAIAFEAYPRMRPSDKHVYFSVSKVLVSTAVALLEQWGRLDVNETIETFFPKLRGTDWDGVRVIDILDMSSGMDCDFNLGDPTSCFRQSWSAYGDPLSHHEDTALADPLDYFARISARRPPGEAFEYADINPLMLTLLVEQISGRTFDEFMEREIWQKIGAESDALLMTAANGRLATPLGVSSNLRDMARFGLLFTPSGREGPNPVISDETLAKIQFGGRAELFQKTEFPNLFNEEPDIRNTYQWDHVTSEGDLYKNGHAGQGLYISPGRDLVIAFFGSWKTGQTRDEIPAVARQLARSGLFDE